MSPRPSRLACSTSEASVSVAWIAFAKQLASEIFIPKSMRSYFMPIELTLYVTSNWRAREASGEKGGFRRWIPIQLSLNPEIQSYNGYGISRFAERYTRGFGTYRQTCRRRGQTAVATNRRAMSYASSHSAKNGGGAANQ